MPSVSVSGRSANIIKPFVLTDQTTRRQSLEIYTEG